MYGIIIIVIIVTIIMNIYIIYIYTYLPTLIPQNQLNARKYTTHGSYASWIDSFVSVSRQPSCSLTVASLVNMCCPWFLLVHMCPRVSSVLSFGSTPAASHHQDFSFSLNASLWNLSLNLYWPLLLGAGLDPSYNSCWVVFSPMVFHRGTPGRSRFSSTEMG